MKTTKLMLGVAAAVLMATGCGGNPSEDACDQIASSAKDAAKRLEACIPGSSSEFSYDKAACVASFDKCADGEIEKVADTLDCTLDAMTCEMMTSEDDSAFLAKVQACVTKYNPSQACLDQIGEMSTPASARQALKRAMTR